ncbi:fructokinase [Klebsiella variicola]|uniref:host cell division inhibitor Icd-like protein n=1 Tax=Klebsiella variicola TaxID=244366 RepID=UPI000E2B0307|nr:host cell division inhibitor Icd-like protein [Klebsiella variicola]SXE51746.1 fructokinase [Klebsiella variicola]
MITATQGKSLSLAGLMFPCSGFKTLAKLSFPLADKGNYFPRIAGEMNCIAASDNRAAWTFATSTRELHHTCSNEFSASIKKGLMFDYIPVYGYKAPAKSGVGISLPEMYRAIHDAPSVFFCVVSQPHTFFSETGIIRDARKIMVGCAGASSEAPVSLYAGKANPAQSTTRQISLCGGGSKTQYKEAAIMATTPTQKPQFIWLIAAVRRDCPTVIAKIHHVAAESEREARRSLVRDHVCFFAGRICMGVSA